MRHPYEKLIRLELITIVLAFVIGLFAIIQTYILLLFLGLFLLAISLILTALVEYHTYRTQEAVKHGIRALFLLLFTAYLTFFL